ncbi:DMT family transporter [Pararhodospirillum oryzae]|uniref:EamA domain-containing protein n=1 Tax=Pararhodospirillum oryzae TaxID=478448 RepID=A0A512H5E8_9PROT|nr:DMT family transporter [Pararhodospirillum oryzae]GEO80661.1 hypothetical protein ROR02_07920 [Pararhodospirillum oryzae]
MAGSSPFRALLFAPPVLLCLAAFFWATNAIVGKIAATAGIPPISLAFWRWTLAVLFILPLTGRALWRQRAVVRRQWPLLLTLGTLSAGAYNALMYAALNHSTALNVSLVGASMPVIMALMARLVLGDRLRVLQWAGIGISLCGVVLVLLRGDPALAASLTLNPGDGLMLLATVSWSAYSVTLRRHPPGLGALEFLTAQMIGGLVILTPLAVWEGASGSGMPLTWTTAWILPYTAVFPALVAFGCWNRGLAAVGPGIAGIYTNLIPVLTALMAVAVLGEQIAWYHGVALVAILGGITLVSARPRGGEKKRPDRSG